VSEAPKLMSGWGRKRTPEAGGRCEDELTPARTWTPEDLEEAKPMAVRPGRRKGIAGNRLAGRKAQEPR